MPLLCRWQEIVSGWSELRLCSLRAAVAVLCARKLCCIDALGRWSDSSPCAFGTRVRLCLLLGVSETEFACSTCAFVRVRSATDSRAVGEQQRCSAQPLPSLPCSCRACHCHCCYCCFIVQGVCASCRKVVVLRTLEDPAKGAAVCLALLSDPALLQSALEPDDEEEAEGIRGQITFMLDAYFDKS